ncbi:MAG: maleylpyruvate isomerase family mycothiol-dependent enzyme [Nocardioides sp.]
MTTQQQSAFDLLGDANQRLTRTVDGFHGDDWAAPSQLPDWTRTHLVAHLVLNAEGIARCLRGVVDDSDEPATMYDSPEQRDSDIVELAGQDPAEIRDRLLAVTTLLNNAMLAVPENGWDGRVERTPGGRSMPTSALPGMRLREVEIHHVDLAASYAVEDWPIEFAEHLLDAMAKRIEPETAFEVKPLDSHRTWSFGGAGAEDRAVVTGPAAEIAWWLTGRSPAENITSSRGPLPEIGAW